MGPFRDSILAIANVLQVQMAIAHAEERHKKQQADAVAKAVREATEHRKVSEERAVQQRVRVESAELVNVLRDSVYQPLHERTAGY